MQNWILSAAKEQAKKVLHSMDSKGGGEVVSRDLFCPLVIMSNALDKNWSFHFAKVFHQPRPKGRKSQLQQ